MPELMITVAIMGTVTAISVPCYLRIRMEVNMEMVKQHMRVIGEKMSEIFNNKKEYPESSRWPDNLTQDEEEQAITANLNSIDMLGYTKGDYTVNQTRNEYVLKCCPKPGEWGKSGDKCFAVHANGTLSGLFSPGVVGTIDQWAGFDDPMTQKIWTMNAVFPNAWLDAIARDGGLATVEQKGERWAIYMEIMALNADYLKNVAIAACTPDCPSNYAAPTTIQIKFDSQYSSSFDQYLPIANTTLPDHGMTFTEVEAGATQNSRTVHVSYTLSDPVTTQAELYQRIEALSL